MKPKKEICNFILRCFLLVAGLFVLALGIALSAKSGLGVSPVSSTAYVLSLVFPPSMGTFNNLMNLLYMLLQFILLGRSIGGYAPMLNAPGSVVWYVVNPYRPWSLDIEHVDKILAEILGVSHIQLDKLRILGNPNLGPDTEASDVISGAEKLNKMISPYKPIDFFCAREELANELNDHLPGLLFPICLYLTYEWVEK